MRISDWSSDVCSSDLPALLRAAGAGADTGGEDQGKEGSGVGKDAHGDQIPERPAYRSAARTRLGKPAANAKGQFARPAPRLTLSCASAKTAGMSWRIRREPRWLTGAALALSLMAPSPVAGAADAARAELAARYPELHAAIYDMTVCEYFGLITPEVAGGFNRRVAELEIGRAHV